MILSTEVWRLMMMRAARPPLHIIHYNYQPGSKPASPVIGTLSKKEAAAVGQV